METIGKSVHAVSPLNRFFGEYIKVNGCNYDSSRGMSFFRKTYRPAFSPAVTYMG